MYNVSIENNNVYHIEFFYQDIDGVFNGCDQSVGVGGVDQ